MTKKSVPTSKEKWVKEQHDKAVQIHWDNIDRIRDLDHKILKKTCTISQLQISISALEHIKCDLQWSDFSKEENKIFARVDHTFAEDEAHYHFGENYDSGIDMLQHKQKELCIEVAALQLEIESNPFKKSCAIMQKDSDEEMLAKKYDELFPTKKEAA